MAWQYHGYDENYVDRGIPVVIRGIACVELTGHPWA